MNAQIPKISRAEICHQDKILISYQSGLSTISNEYQLIGQIKPVPVALN